MIAEIFKLESPYKQSMMATLTNGSAGSGYIPNEAAFGYNTFEVVSSRLKPGCAEDSIVIGLVDLIGETDAIRCTRKTKGSCRPLRSEERRVGQGCVSTCSLRRSALSEKQQKRKKTKKS